MVIKVIQTFHDALCHTIRKPGETFSATEDRFAEIDSKLPGYVERCADVEERDYSKYTRPQLIEMIGERGLPLPKRQNKADLIAVLEG